MKKLISTLAAFALICGSFAGVSSPLVSVSSANAAGVGAADIYDFEDSQKKIDTIEENGMVFDTYGDGTLRYAVLKSVKDTSVTELTIPSELDADYSISIWSTVYNPVSYKIKGKYEVVGIEWGAFADCDNLKKLNLSKSIAVINWFDIAEECIEEITVDEENEYFTVVDGILYTKDMKNLVACPPASGKTEIKLPAETEAIAEGAFACCKTLKKAELSDNVKEIAPLVFFGCSGLEEINLPDGLKVLGNGTFAGCSSLKQITIPESVERIDSSAFKDTGCIERENGIHYVDNWAVGADNDIENAEIREGTIGTAEYLFVSKKSLKVLTVPASVKHVGSYLAFGIDMPLELVQFYCHEIPERCIFGLNVKEVQIYDPHCKIADSTSAIVSYWREPEAIEGQKDQGQEQEYVYTLSHKTVTVGSSSSGASSIQKKAHASLIEIDEDDAEEPDIATITRVGWNSDTSGSGDETSTYDKIQKYMEKAKANDESAPKVYAAPVRKTGHIRYDTVIRGFEGSTAEAYALKYKRCFAEFEKASANVGPEIYTDDLANLTYWIYGQSHASVRIDGTYKDYKDIVIPDSINGVPVTTFVVNCNVNAGRVTLPASIEYFTDSIDLQYDNTAYYEVSEDNPYYRSVDGIIYNKDMTELVKVPSKYEISEIVIPDTVKTIRRGACHSLKHVSSIALPEGLEVIGANAFCGAGKLSKIVLPENLDTICDGAFNGCTSLTEINIPENVKHIGYNAFDECPAVTYENGHGYLGGWLVDVEDNIRNVAPKYGTTGIARVSARSSFTIPQSVTKMSWEMVPDNGISIMERADVYSHTLSFDAFKCAFFMKDIYIYDPECEICEGPQTIPAQHLVFDENSSSIRSIFDNRWPCNALTRTPARELRTYAETSIADTVIHGYKGSTAEVYANFYGLKFSAIEDEDIYKNGDLNGDGKLETSDLVIMSKYIAGDYLFTQPQFKAADLNGDGKADVFDLVELRKALISE